MGRTIWRNDTPGESDWAMDDNAAEGLALGMTEQEAEAWSCFEDFVSTVGMATHGRWGGYVPEPIATHIAAIRSWMLAQPQERRLANMTDVEPMRTAVR